MPGAKVGDRCFVTGDVLPANLGKIVRVIEPSIFAPIYDWYVETEGSPLDAVSMVDGDTRSAQRAHTLDRNLIPIPPEADEQPAPPAVVPVDEVTA